jgi:parallel beta-helix repeat protein
MKNGFLIHWAAKVRRNKLKWRAASTMLPGIALLFAFQGFSRADDDDGDHNATAIAICPLTPISNPGRYFLVNDLMQCAITINGSDIKLELRGHTIQGTSAGSTIFVDGGATGISKIEIGGPGTVTGGGTAGIDFENVQHSRVHNLVVVGNLGPVVANAGVGVISDGIDINVFNSTIESTFSTGNEFRDNVVTASSFGIRVSGGNGNRFTHNNLSGNALDGLFLDIANDNFVHQNTIDSNGQNGIEVQTGSVNNNIDGNTALGNATDLLDSNGCPSPNFWGQKVLNSFFTSFPLAPSCIQ